MKRQLLFATAFIALAACSPKTEPVAAAPAEPAAPAAPAIAPIPASETVHPFQIGALQAASLKDGGAEVPNDGKTFAINMKPADVKTLLAANGVTSDGVPLSIQPMLLKTADSVLLFDTGLGSANKGLLPASLEAAGVKPADVNDIFISHSHYDHVGGLAGADGALAFPNAAIHMSKNEWTAMQANKTQAALVAAITPKVVTFDPGAELVPGVVTAVDIKGHTPGHSGYRITSGDQSLLYIGDTMHSSIVSVQRPDWTIAFDDKAPIAQESRKALLADTAASGQRIYAVHFPFPGLGKFEKKGDGFVWAPES
jgi:glyoxylase-like metal-dependent hydrolase (beta-lactamase superfamily II)